MFKACAKVVGWIWCFPLTLIGLVLAFLGGAWPYKLRPAGVIQFRDRFGLWEKFFSERHYYGLTIGAVSIFADDPTVLDNPIFLRHERQHTYQAFVLGILFPFFYFGAMLYEELRHDPDPYRDDWFEAQAYRDQADING